MKTVGKRGTPSRAQVSLAQAQIEELIAQGQVSRFIIRTLMAEPSDLTFIAPTLPPHGYATFTIRPTSAPSATGDGAHQTPDPLILENDLFIVQVDPPDGTITVTDKINDVVYPGLNRFVIDGFPAESTQCVWCVQQFHNQSRNHRQDQKGWMATRPHLWQPSSLQTPG